VKPAARDPCRGLRPLVWPLPDAGHEPTLLAVVQLAAGRPATVVEQELFKAIQARHTNRAPFSDAAVPPTVRADLGQAPSLEYAALRMLSRQETTRVIECVAAADGELATDPMHLSGPRQWISAGGTGNGVPPLFLAPRPDEELAPVRGWLHPRHIQFVRRHVGLVGIVRCRWRAHDHDRAPGPAYAGPRDGAGAGQRRRD
jgi:hypothetical protein